MELFPPAWRLAGHSVSGFLTSGFLALGSLAAIALLTVGCGDREASAPLKVAASPASETSLIEQEPASMELPATEVQLVKHSWEIRRLPALEIKSPKQVLDAPLVRELPPVESLPLPDPLPPQHGSDDGAYGDGDGGDDAYDGDAYGEETYIDDAYTFAPFEMFQESQLDESDLLEPERTESEFVAAEPVELSSQRASSAVASPGRVYSAEEIDDDALYAAKASASDVLAYFPAESELGEQFRPEVQAAFTLARNGALHAARDRFESILLQLARAKDASQMTDRHSRALAAGLRALEEADDFLMTRSEQSIDTLALAAGHQTPMLRDASLLQDRSKWTLPHEAIAMYHRYAERKLGAATGGEQSGSMVLYGLGKIYQQLAARHDTMPQALRKSLTMYRGAVLAHPQNHLAANEAGVLLARAGRFEQALPLLEQAVQLAQSSVTHQNLAYVYAKRGAAHLAQSHEYKAQQLAMQEKARGQLSAERGIAWMSPQEFNRRSGGASARPAASLESRPQATALPARPQVAARPADGSSAPANRPASSSQSKQWW